MVSRKSILAIALGGLIIVGGYAVYANFPAAKAAIGQTTPNSDVLASVNGATITDQDIAPLLAGGLDKANAVDRAINRAIAAELGQKEYASDVATAVRATEREVAANVYATKKMQELVKSVTDQDLRQRYEALVKDADFNAYKLTFAVFASDTEARAALDAYKAGKSEAVALFKPVASGKAGEPLFVGRNDVPYNLGVFVAKLKQGEFTEPALVRNGYIVLHAQEIKSNPKPAFDSVKESLRATVADERLAVRLAEARKLSSVNLK